MGMAWTNRYEGGYAWTLTDGLFDPASARVRAVRDARGPPELIPQYVFAEHVYRHVKRQQRSQWSGRKHNTEQLDQNSYQYPQRIDVWVLGSHERLAKAPELVQKVAQGESSPSYRILVIGRSDWSGTGDPPPHAQHNGPTGPAARPDRITNLGLRRQHHHYRRQFERAAHDLLSALFECDPNDVRLKSVTPRPMGPYNASLVYYGDSGMKMDPPFRGLIQQNVGDDLMR